MKPVNQLNAETFSRVSKFDKPDTKLTGIIQKNIRKKKNISVRSQEGVKKRETIGERKSSIEGEEDGYRPK